jgi:hypothetical protein
MDGKKKAQLDRNHFSPSNIMTILIPTGFEFPKIPLITEDNADTPGRGYIDPKLYVGSRRWFRKYRTAEVSGEMATPPLNVG